MVYLDKKEVCRVFWQGKLEITVCLKGKDAKKTVSIFISL